MWDRRPGGTGFPACAFCHVRRADTRGRPYEPFLMRWMSPVTETGSVTGSSLTAPP